MASGKSRYSPHTRRQSPEHNLPPFIAPIRVIPIAVVDDPHPPFDKPAVNINIFNHCPGGIRISIYPDSRLIVAVWRRIAVVGWIAVTEEKRQTDGEPETDTD